MLIVVSNSGLCAMDIVDCLSEAARGGADFVMVREKDLGYEELLDISTKVANATARYGSKLIVNSSIEAAKNAGAYAVQLSFADFMRLADEEKEEIERQIKIGVSVHSEREASLAQKNGADYVVAGHIFDTNCKKGLAPRGLGLIEGIKKSCSIPIIAIGGIDSGNAISAIEGGARGVAVMSIVMESMDPCGEVLKIKNAMMNAQQNC